MKIEPEQNPEYYFCNCCLNPYSNGMEIEPERVSKRRDRALVLILILME